jgi:hypothetical protein
MLWWLNMVIIQNSTTDKHKKRTGKTALIQKFAGTCLTEMTV